MKANSRELSDAGLVQASQKLLVSGDYLNTAAGHVGEQDAKIWSDYGSFLFKNGLLTDADGKALTTEPDWTTYYTNAYLPAARPGTEDDHELTPAGGAGIPSPLDELGRLLRGQSPAGSARPGWTWN